MDATPDWELSQQLIRMQIAEQDWTLERHKHGIMEQLTKIKNNLININGTRLVLKELEEKQDLTGISLQRSKSQIAAHNATLERQILENMEAEDRIQYYKDAIKATIKAKEDYITRLHELEKVHGISQIFQNI